MTIYNVQTYGAVGNGSSRPASGSYGTLAALQAVYGTTVGGVTIALTNELDWLGVQKAIDVAETNGGNAYAPSTGTFYNMTNANSVSDGSGTLLFNPSSTIPLGVGPGADLYGDNQSSTVIYWGNDLGSGRAAISCDPANATHAGATGRYGATSFYEGRIHDLFLQGPGSFTITPGTAPAAMDGVVLGARRSAARVTAKGFRAAWNHVGDYAQFDNCFGVGSYYGWYEADANAGLYGDIRWNRCMFGGNAMAAVGVSKDGQVNGLNADSCYLGNNPYCFLLESGVPASYGQPNPGAAITSSKFTRANCEFVTNQFILDDNATVGGGGNTGTRTRSVQDTEFNDSNIFISGTPYTSGGRGAYAYVDCDACYGVKFTLVDGGSFGAHSGQLAGFLLNSVGVNNSGGVTFEGALDAVLATYETNGVQFLACTDPLYGPIGIFGNGGNRAMQLVKPGEWNGNPEYMADTVAVQRYAVMERVNYNAVQLGGTATMGTAPVAGINKQAWPVNSNGKMTIVATRCARTDCSVNAAQTNGGLVQMGTGGHAVAATSLTSGVLVGWVQNYNGGSTSDIVITTLFNGF